MKTTLIKSLVLMVLILGACKTPDYVYEKSGHAIDLDKSKNLYKNYKTNVLPAVNTTQKDRLNRDKYNGTEYVLVSIQQLENYIKFLKYVEKQNNQKITGIAIFLGAHSDSMTLDSLPKFNHNIKSYEKMNQKNDRQEGDMRGRTTMFFAPTYRDKNTISIDGTPYENEFERHIPFYLTKTELDNKYKGTYTNLYRYLKNIIPAEFNTGIRSVGEPTSLNANEFNSMPPKQ